MRSQVAQCSEDISRQHSQDEIQKCIIAGKLFSLAVNRLGQSEAHG
jgi:hypothetical protein